MLVTVRAICAFPFCSSRPHGLKIVLESLLNLAWSRPSEVISRSIKTPLGFSQLFVGKQGPPRLPERVSSESRQLTWLRYLYDVTEDPFPVYPFDLICLTSLQHPIVPFRDIFKILGMAEVGFHVWKVTGLRFLIAWGERNTFRLMD